MKKTSVFVILLVLLLASCILMNHSPTYAGEWQGFQTVTYESSQDEGNEAIYTTVLEYQFTNSLMVDFAMEKNNDGVLIDLSGTIYFIDFSFLGTNKLFSTAGVRYPFYNKDPTYYTSVTYRF